MRTCTDTMRTANDTPRISVHTAKDAVDYWAEVFSINLNSTCLNLNNYKKYYVFMKITPLIGCHIRIGRHVTTLRTFQNSDCFALQMNMAFTVQIMTIFSLSVSILPLRAKTVL